MVYSCVITGRRGMRPRQQSSWRPANARASSTGGEPWPSESCHHRISHADLVGCLCFASHGQRGHLETGPPFTVPCEGREAWFIHRSHRESNPGPLRGSLLYYCCATPTPLSHADSLCPQKITLEDQCFDNCKTRPFLCFQFDGDGIRINSIQMMNIYECNGTDISWGER